MTDERDDQVLPVLLEECAGAASPPDLRGRFSPELAAAAAQRLARAGHAPRDRRRSRWLTAAVLAIGVGVVWAIVRTASEPASPTAATAPQDGPAAAARRLLLRVRDPHGGPVPQFEVSFLAIAVGVEGPAYIHIPTQPPRRIAPRDLVDQAVTLTGLPGGRFVLVIKAEPFATYVSEPLDPDLGPALPTVEAKLGQGSEVAGIVRSASGAPVEGATVWLDRPDWPRRSDPMRELLLRVRGDVRDARTEVLDDIWPSQTARTDAEGRFRFARLPRGEYAVHVEHPDYAIGQARRLELGPAVVEAVDLVLHKGATLTGTVLRGGKPVADFPLLVNVEVAVEVAGSSPNTSGVESRSQQWHRSSIRTDPDGGFELLGLAPGEYRIMVVPTEPIPGDLLPRALRCSAPIFTILPGQQRQHCEFQLN